ncbi:MAG: chemotaxis protein chel [Rhizobiales bacterium]|nr:chemotaxis protein chel [Hyphomicrobiales bacterium]
MSGVITPAVASPASAAASYASIGVQPPVDPRVRAREQAVEFEAVFLNNMFSQMFTGIDGDGPFGGGKAGIWRSFLTDEYSKSFAKAGGIGIADHVYRALLNQQEARAG